MVVARSIEDGNEIWHRKTVDYADVVNSMTDGPLIRVEIYARCAGNPNAPTRGGAWWVNFRVQ